VTKLINSCGKFFGFFLFSSFYQRLLAIALAFVILLGSSEMAMAQTTNQVTISGTFIVNWGDSRSGTGVEILSISDKAGKATVLNIDPKVLEAAGGFGNLNGKTVTITGKPAVITQVGTDPALRVDAIVVDSKTLENFQKQVVSGSKAYVNILCQFPEQNLGSSYPQYVSKYNSSYFNGLMGSNYPGMSYYWNEASYGLVNLNGTITIGPVTLPHTRSYYIPTATADSNSLNSLFDDCTQQVDPSVNFANYFGVNMLFNSDLDSSAWGGRTHTVSRDGVYKSWPATWLPPWGWAAQTIVAHEMGHSFGLRHSKFNGANSPYNNYWDVMSYTGDCSRATDPTYGCLGQQTNIDYKDILGWIPANQKFTYSGTAPKTITLEQSDLPVTGNYKMVSIPYGSNGYFYTVEARRRVGYDTKLAANAVIIHEIEPVRDPQPAWVQGTNGSSGAQWLPGMTFTDATNNVKVRVEAATASGFTITINPAPPSAPPNFVATSSSTNQINLSWNDVVSEDGYKIESSSDGGTNYSLLTTLGANITSYSNTGLSPGSTRYYRVWAYNILGDSVKAGPVNTTTIPDIPTSLVANLNGTNQIDLSWGDVTGEGGYKIQRSPDNSNWTPISGVGANVLNYSDQNLAEGTYYYRVIAFNSSGNSTPSSSSASVTTAPYTPGGLYTLATSATQISLSWNNYSVINDGYIIQRATNLGFTTSLVSFTVASVAPTSYTDSSVSSGTTYYYRVKATKAGPPLVESSYSQVAHATPGNVLVVSVGTDDGNVNTPGTLSAALSQATSGNIINFNVIGNQITVTGTLPNVPAGVTISGSCASGPGVTIQGSGGTGLRFNTGSYSLFGLKIQGFGQPQIGPVLGAFPKYTMKCVAINNQ